MKIAFVTPEFLKNGSLYPGGLASYTFNMAKALKSLNQDVLVFFYGETSRKFEFEDIEVVEIKNAPYFLRRILKLLFFKSADAFIDRFLAGIWMQLAIKRYPEKEVIDLWHYSNWKALGVFNRSKNAVLRISSFESLWDNNPKRNTLDKILCRKLEIASIRRFNHVLGPGAYLAKVIEKELNIKRPIHILPTPLPNSFQIAENKSASTKPLKKIIYIGTLSHIKGAKLLFSIIERYLSQYADSQFICIGKAGSIEGTSALDFIHSMSASFPELFNYQSHLDREDILEILSEADVALIPSVIDNFPNTALEAMSAGTLVIASKTSSLDSLVVDHQNGFILDSRNPDVWIHTIRKVLFDTPPAQLTLMREKMIQSLVPHHPKNTAIELLNFYQEVIHQVKIASKAGHSIAE